MRIFECLFQETAGASFIETCFPCQPCVAEGELSRLSRVLKHSLEIRDLEEFLSRHGHADWNKALIISVFDSDLRAGIEILSAIQEDLDLRGNQVIGSFVYGPQGACVCKHYDGNEGLSIQIVGRKKWKVAPPTDIVLPGNCRGDKNCMPENSRSFVLREGSVSFLPRGWWHETEALSRSVSLNVEIHTDVWGHLFSRSLYRQLLEYPEWRTPVPLATAAQREAARSKLA